MNSRRQSLRTRLWITYTLLVVIVLCIVGAGLFAYIVKNPTPIRVLYARLQSIAVILAQTNRLPANESAARLQTALERADENYDARVTIVDLSDPTAPRIVADSRSALGEPPFPSERMLQAEPAILPAQYRDASGGLWIYATRRAANNLIVMVSAPRPEVNWRSILREEFISPLAQAGLVAFLLASLLAYWIANWIARPLQQLAQAAHDLQVAAPNNEPAAPINIKGPAEVHEVAEAFYAMAQRVYASQQSQRDFVANVSHDLKTPLTAIQGFAQAILDGTASTSDDLQKAARIIHSEAGRMFRMVLDLLELARLDSGIAGLNLEEINLNNILEQVVEQFSLQSTRSQVQVTLNAPILPAIQGDRDRLARLFANLLDNALKHTPPGEIVYIQAHANADSIEVRFIDRGPGLPADALDRVFERFYQTDKSRSGVQRGTGLGLSIAREIVHAHGGTISAYNNAPTNPVTSNNQTRAVSKDQVGDSIMGSNAAGATIVVKLPLAQFRHQLRLVDKDQ